MREGGGDLFILLHQKDFRSHSRDLTGWHFGHKLISLYVTLMSPPFTPCGKICKNLLQDVADGIADDAMWRMWNALIRFYMELGRTVMEM